MKVVLANGCFDPLHGGHVLHLKAARALGDKLIVSVTRNEYVNKGPERPAWDEKVRMAVVAELRCVDEVILVKDALEALELVRPNVFVKGAEYRGKIQPRHQAYCFANRIRIAFTDEQIYSSTRLLHDRIRQG